MTQKINIVDGAPHFSNDEWIPKPGFELNRFLSVGNKTSEITERIRREAISILGGCVDPNNIGSKAGLVIGRVQSGKTSSFTAVSALAHDNGFKLIVVIAGTNHLLVEQTTDRLKIDLGLMDENAFQRWALCALSSRDKAQELAGADSLKTRIKALAGTDEPLFNGVPIVIVMKNHAALTRLNTILKDLRSIDGINYSKFPALIIDDEAHMHSPDVGEAESPSVVYECIRNLASHFPTKSILQYTATPQANLLMEIGSEMSPDFVRLLEPGDGYIGGKELFSDSSLARVRNIPETDYPKKPKETDPPPSSLRSALANFLLVCAIDYVSTNTANSRSMLVHSDVQAKIHNVYEHWIRTIIESWQIILEDDSCDIPKLFYSEFDDLMKTIDSIQNKKINLESLRAILIKVISNLRIQTVNHTKDVGRVNYNLAPYWIINGGNILGVGYTIVGLVTTHMMRKPGMGMADTIQQRGRFFGYLNKRYDEVRVFITDSMAKRFKDYAEHEEGLRNSLARYDSSSSKYDQVGTPKLKDWKRVFWLDPSMTPTRKKAQRLMLERASIDKDGWLPQKHLTPFELMDLDNQKLLNNFYEMIKVDPRSGWFKSDAWGGDPNGESNVHLEAAVSIQQLLDLLTNVHFAASDEGDMNSAILAIEENTLDPDTEKANVYLIAKGSENRDFVRTRTLGPGGQIDLFQGRGEGPDAYVGDRKVQHPSRVSIQIHIIDFFPSKDRNLPPERSHVPTFAIHLPKVMHDWAKNILKQG